MGAVGRLGQMHEGQLGGLGRCMRDSWESGADAWGQVGGWERCMGGRCMRSRWEEADVSLQLDGADIRLLPLTLL